MKVLRAFCLFFLAAVTGYAQVKVTGKIRGLLPTEKVYLDDIDLGQILDSASTTNGNFSLTIQQPINKKYGLRTNNRFTRFFWVEGKDVLIDAKADDFFTDPLISSKEYLAPIVASGSTAQKEEDLFYAGNARLLRLIDTLSHPYEMICDNSVPKRWVFLKKFYNSVAKTNKPINAADIDRMIHLGSPYIFPNGILIEKQLNKANKQLNEQKWRFAASHPNSPVSAYFLAYFGPRQFTAAHREIKKVYHSLSLANQGSFYGRITHDLVTYYSDPQVGDKFTDISLKDTSSNNLPLASFKGKVVILEFWSSDCYPSWYGRNMLLPLYNKYHKEGLEIYTVSIDGAYADWKKSVKTTNMPWTDVWTPGGFFGPISFTYNIARGTPVYFIIDRQGKIVNTTWDAEVPVDETGKILRPLLYN